jgi:hypothetical protein
MCSIWSSGNSPDRQFNLKKGIGMRKILAVMLIAVFAVSALSIGSARAQPKGTLQVGVGSAFIIGSSAASNFDMLTLQVAGLYFPSEWSVLLADFSYGFPHEYTSEYESGTESYEVNANYFDIMAGFASHFSGGGFLYLGLGLSAGWGDYKESGNAEDFKIETGYGLGLGFGVQVPIKETFGGFLNMRQRFISADLASDDERIGMSTGGLELSVGVAWTFGAQ